MTALFAEFEVNRTPWWSHVARLIGGSVALHLILAATILYVPGLRSAFNIAGSFQGVRYVDAAYDRTL
ncbi:MAG TPA: hypothetical protein VF507_05100, partial [Pyrinomonadaceae bacterium]